MQADFAVREDGHDSLSRSVGTEARLPVAMQICSNRSSGKRLVVGAQDGAKSDLHQIARLFSRPKAARWRPIVATGFSSSAVSA